MSIDLNTSLHQAMSQLPDFGQDILMTFIQQGILQPGMTLKEALLRMDKASDYHYEMFDKVMEQLMSARQSEPSADVRKFDDVGPRSIGDVLSNSVTVKNEKKAFDNGETGVTVNQLMEIADADEMNELDFIIGRLFMSPDKDVSVLLMKLNTLLSSDLGGAMAGVGGATDISNPSRVPTMNAGNSPEQRKQLASKKFATDALELVNDLLLKFKSPEQKQFVDYLDNLDDGENTKLLSILKDGYIEIFNS